MKTIILTADNLGLDISSNRAIFEAFHAGSIQSASLLANGEAFDDSIDNVIRECPSLEIGIQLNINEGKSLITDYDSYLTADDGYYNLNSEKLLLLSGRNKYKAQIEAEFCSQIDKVLSKGIKPVFLTSNLNIHAIPAIFDITCKIASYYKIANIRTQTELPYFVPELYKHVESKYLSNAGANLILSIATRINQNSLKKYNLQTNDYLIGILYSDQMDKSTILNGIKQLPPNTVTEIVFHPTINKWKHLKYLEYKTLIDSSLKSEIESQNCSITLWSKLNYKEENKENTTPNQYEQQEDKKMQKEKEIYTKDLKFNGENKYETTVHSIKIKNENDSEIED